VSITFENAQWNLQTGNARIDKERPPPAQQDRVPEEKPPERVFASSGGAKPVAAELVRKLHSDLDGAKLRPKAAVNGQITRPSTH
jgi:hypothetical protein